MEPGWHDRSGARPRTGPRRRGIAVAVAGVAVSLAAAGCAVDPDGVLRPTTAADVTPAGGESLDVDAAACGDLLASLRESAMAVVGPRGLPAADAIDRFDGFRGPVIIDRGFGFEGDLGEATTLSTGASDAVALGDRLVTVRDGWLHVLDAAADEPIESTWLGSAALGADPLVIEEDGALVVVHETTSTIGDQSGRAVRVARIAIDDAEGVTVEESVEVLGSLAGVDLHEGVLQFAVQRPVPALDLVQATTPGSEAAALEVNRRAIEATTIDDWVPVLRYRGSDAEPVDELVGGCDAVVPPGSETALGTTALLRHDHGASLAEMSGDVVMGEGLVSFAGDRAWLLSPRNSVVGAPGGGVAGLGADRVVVARLASDDDGYRVEAAGVVAGRLQTPAGVPVGDDGALIFTSQDQWGQQLTVTSVAGDTELTPLDSRSLNLEWWGPLSSSVVGDTLVLNRQGGSAIVDLTSIDDLQIETRTARFDRGNRVAAPQIVSFGDDYLASSGGQIVEQWGSADVFFEQILANEFGGAPRLQDWFGQPGEVSVDLRRGGTGTDDVVASWTAEAFGLWIVASDPDAASIIVGVAGLRDPENPPILGGELFTGAVSLEIVGDEIVERGRVRFEPARPDDIGASECDRADVDQFFLDVAGLWNAQLFTCAPGVGAGVVGYSCVGAEFGDVDAQMLAWNWGITDTTAIETQVDELRQVIDEGGSVIACRDKAPVEVDVPIAEVASAGGDRWVTTTTGVARWVPGAEEISVIGLEPPYGD